jgi:hypothetical protein
MALQTNGELRRHEDQQLIDLILAAPQMRMKLTQIRNWLSNSRFYGLDLNEAAPKMLESIDLLLTPRTGQADQSTNVQ